MSILKIAFSSIRLVMAKIILDETILVILGSINACM